MAMSLGLCWLCWLYWVFSYHIEHQASITATCSEPIGKVLRHIPPLEVESFSGGRAQHYRLTMRTPELRTTYIHICVREFDKGQSILDVGGGHHVGRPVGYEVSLPYSTDHSALCSALRAQCSMLCAL